jgi:hypothetical protein
MGKITRKETAKRLGISERTLRRKFKNIFMFDLSWVDEMEYLMRLKRKINVAIKADKEVRKELRNQLFT